MFVETFPKLAGASAVPSKYKWPLEPGPRGPGLTMNNEQSGHLFEELSPEQNVVEIESLCMQCHEKVGAGGRIVAANAVRACLGSC